MVTTIQIEEETRRMLERMKLFPRETYDHAIKRLLHDEEDEVLSQKAIKNIEAALKDVKEGRTYSTKEAKKRLGIR